MSWTRFDDNWYVKMESAGLNSEEIGYLVGLIQYCSRSNKYDGVLSAFKARGITEVDDPDGILAHLHEVGRVAWDGKQCIVLHLDDHLPPPAMREGVRKESETARKRRYRAHLKDDHSYCTDATCPTAVPPGQTRDTADGGQGSPDGVPAGPGTGQDWPGLEEVPATQTRDEIDPWASASPPEQVLDLRHAPAAGCSWCRNSAVPGCPNCETTMSEVG